MKLSEAVEIAKALEQELCTERDHFLDAADALPEDIPEHKKYSDLARQKDQQALAIATLLQTVEYARQFAANIQ